MVMMKYKMVNDVIIILLVLIMASYCYAENSKQRLDDVKKLLKSVNKQALKSIKSPDGDIIDCVDIFKQPAFDDPSLKNHTIQMKPNYLPEELFLERKMSFKKSGENESRAIFQLWNNSGKCPKGTIPIRRTKEEDVLRASSIKNYGKKNFTSVPRPKSDYRDLNSNNEHQYAIAAVARDKYFGAMATINVWKPEVQQPYEFSLSQFWVLGGPFDSGLNTIEAGWMVHPNLFKDHNTRLFIYWTRDAYQKTGCYNLLCSGFMQTNNKIALGASIAPISGYQGSQYDITLLVWKDPKGGNWWLKYQNEVLGYWPATLFTYLQQSASLVQWGGEIVNAKTDGHHTTTQMGSGHFPDERFGKASFFKNILLVDGSNAYYAPQKLTPFAAQPNCYNIQLAYNKDWGNYFYYGGPGRNPKCP